MADYLKFAKSTARQAGKLLNAMHSKVARNYRTKSTALDIVTKADIASEKLIVSSIKRSFPSHHIMAEEECSCNHNKTANLRGMAPDAFCWVIDPLDGTTNYSHGFPFYCVSIALYQGAKTIAGVVYNPTMDEMFYASPGKGAYLNGKKILVSNIKSLSQGLLVTGFPYIIKEQPGDNFTNFYNFSLTAQAVRRAGAAALDLCYVACGRFDGFWERELKPWDTSAGALILREAKGRATDFNNRPYDAFNHREILASNKFIHRQMKSILDLNRKERIKYESR